MVTSGTRLQQAILVQVEVRASGRTSERPKNKAQPIALPRLSSPELAIGSCFMRSDLGALSAPFSSPSAAPSPWGVRWDIATATRATSIDRRGRSIAILAIAAYRNSIIIIRGWGLV